MCSCDINLLRRGFSGKELLQDLALRETLHDYKVINGRAFKEGKTLQIMQYVSCLDPEQFYGMFRNIGVDLSPSDLVQFSQIVDNKGDVNGEMANRQGQPVYFDARKMIMEMKFSPEQVQNSACQIQFIE